MGLSRRFGKIASQIISIIYPRLCEVCGTALTEGEEHICLKCLYNMPLCRLDADGFNIIHQRLASHIPIERATGLFYYYRGNPYTRLIHAAKYNGRPRIASHLASLFARRLQPSGFFDGIDLITYVPLHYSRQLRRGYNQSEHIALGISRITSITTLPTLIVTRRHNTQTRRDHYHRWLNSLHTYAIDPDATQLSPRHILLVDDVITTGSTILACLEALHHAYPAARLSVLTLAVSNLS